MVSMGRPGLLIIWPAPVAGGCGGVDAGWSWSKQKGLPKDGSLNLSLPIPATIEHTLVGVGVVPGGRGPGSVPCALSTGARAKQTTVTATSPIKSLRAWQHAAFIWFSSLFRMKPARGNREPHISPEFSNAKKF